MITLRPLDCFESASNSFHLYFISHFEFQPFYLLNFDQGEYPSNGKGYGWDRNPDSGSSINAVMVLDDGGQRSVWQLKTWKNDNEKRGN